jgi:D-alanyl-lipoteichoic acid acyltransferase DltB (MBOAT superfamily)
MLFNSLTYIVFLIPVILTYYLFPVRWRWIILLAASVLYYISFVPAFLTVIAGLIILNYFFSLWLALTPAEKGKYLITIVVLSNIAVLAFFKYFSFIFPDAGIQLHNSGFFGKDDQAGLIMLPLGLSYLVFTVLAYQIEIKRKSLEPVTHPGYFSLYLVFFPKIAQGPIERPQHFIPQLYQDHPFRPEDFTEGLKMIITGYFKKLVVADRLAIYVNAVYNNSEYHGGISLLLATVFFAFQIYADFSGYTDIAMGSARLFGFELTNNFRRPYLALSVKDFWDRWHITFSTWLRDYIFLPVAFSLAHRMTRKTCLGISTDKWIYAIAILITFGICGIWHGVGWTFLFWGLLFGIYLAFSNSFKDLRRKWRKRSHIDKKSPGYTVFSILVTFVLVLIAWVFFRADSLSEAFNIIGKILSMQGDIFFKPSELGFALLAIGSLIFIDLKHEFRGGRHLILHSSRFPVRLAGVVFLVVSILLLGVFDGSQFIYFQF